MTGSPAKVSAARTVTCPPERLYELVSDLPRMREWSPESTGGRWVTGGGPVVGARFVGRNRSGWRRWTTLTTVVAADPPHRFAFRVSAPVVPIASWEYTIEAADGGCRVVESWVDLRPGPVRLVSTLRTGIADRTSFTRTSIEHTLDALGAAAERLTTQDVPAGIVER